MSTATEEKIIRSLDFPEDNRDSARKKALFHCELIEDYVRQTFQIQPAYAIEHMSDSPGNHTYRIRKGSGELRIETNFGMNTAYGPGGPRNYYTLSLEAAHRNLALDATVETNNAIVWCLRIIFGFLLGFPLALAGMKFGAGPFLFLVLGAGAAVGGFIGNVFGHAYYAWRERQLTTLGEIDEVAEDWGHLSDTLEMIMIENEGFSYTKRRGANIYE